MKCFIFLVTLLQSALVSASAETSQYYVLTLHWVGLCAIGIFVIAYAFVILEERLDLRKSKPMLLAAGLIWVLIAFFYQSMGDTHAVEASIRHNFLEYSELFFFLLVAMTYINAMQERGVFNALRDWLINKGLSYRSLFWATGILAFFISAVADNLTTALIMCAVVLSVGKTQQKFVAIGCINIVVAANAGGAFSPFGDITTLMVWQKGMLAFRDFFSLFIPSVANYLIPAIFMHFAVPRGSPVPMRGKAQLIKDGGLVIVALFLLTIVTAISFQNFLHLPPVFGMLTGLAYVKLFGYYLQQKERAQSAQSDNSTSNNSDGNFDIFDNIARAEWDTLFFFYGIVMAVGGLGFIGYLAVTSEFIYGELGVTHANILVGVISAIVDNIPVMFAILSMQPDMSEFQWLLVTLTAGVGGSMVSIGSASGVALMGQARGQYTFFSHLKWTPVIMLGYVGSIGVHFLVNG